MGITNVSPIWLMHQAKSDNSCATLGIVIAKYFYKSRFSYCYIEARAGEWSLSPLACVFYAPFLLKRPFPESEWRFTQYLFLRQLSKQNLTLIL